MTSHDSAFILTLNLTDASGKINWTIASVQMIGSWAVQVQGQVQCKEQISWYVATQPDNEWNVPPAHQDFKESENALKTISIAQIYKVILFSSISRQRSSGRQVWT